MFATEKAGLGSSASALYFEVPVSICVGSATVLSRFISVGFEVLSGSGYEKFLLLGCNAMYSIKS
jgi:hypothetical protein